MKNIILIIIFLCGNNLYSQSLSVFEADTTSYPTIKAKFFAIDAAGKQITNLSVSDFQVTENGQQRTVTTVSCPAPKQPEALSSVLVIDVSGSMKGWNLNMAKEAAKAWLEYLPLGKSECAITAFDTKNYLIQDFSTDRNLLNEKVNSLIIGGGTNYDAALFIPEAGGLLVVKAGKNKKVIVFLSDGAPNSEPQISKIISEATANNISIYTVILGMPCPQSMKYVSAQTGGMWFDNIRTVEEAKKVYQMILQIAQNISPCSIEWLSGYTCYANSVDVEVNLLRNNTKSNLWYQPSSKAIAKLEFSPSQIKFFNSIPGKKVTDTITVTARNSDFKVSNITSTNAAYTISPNSFELLEGQSTDLVIGYLPADSGYTYSRFEFDNVQCPIYYYYAGGGFPGKKPTVRTLKLLIPNGGENFVVGSDTLITWEGVPPTEKVTLEYSIDNGANWLKISDTARGLSYNWRVPKTPGNQCLARVTAKTGLNDYDINMVQIPAGTFQMGNTGAYKGTNDEDPPHKVILTRAFLMSQYEITQKQYTEIIGANSCFLKGDNLPIYNVKWYDCIAFCNKLSEIEGFEPCYRDSSGTTICDFNANGYRLPTEAEWEWACRAGTTTDFYTGNLTNSNCNPLDGNLDLAGWYCGNSNQRIQEVGQKTPNSYGLFDMHGNVKEWCWNVFYYYNNPEETDPIGPNLPQAQRVVRGGSYDNGAELCRTSYRYRLNPSNFYFDIGFRIVRNNK
ncbi:MAG: hypothetical protein QG635_769 [Bacteroidota bacterium]|nr:hypothetical protein [Bacteroidota bacterium]